eukprot:scaffold2510_cov169-Amphora_coffeaeformis.AAC.28
MSILLVIPPPKYCNVEPIDRDGRRCAWSLVQERVRRHNSSKERAVQQPDSKHRADRCEEPLIETTERVI